MIAALIILALIFQGILFALSGIYLAASAGSDKDRGSRNLATGMAIGAALSFSTLLAVLLGATP